MSTDWNLYSVLLDATEAVGNRTEQYETSRKG